MSSTSSLDSSAPTYTGYFSAFSGFSPNPNLPIAEEFARLAAHRGWARGSKNYNAERRRCLESEYDSRVRLTGSAGLERWQALCADVGIDSRLPSVTQCRNVCCGQKTPLVNEYSSPQLIWGD